MSTTYSIVCDDCKISIEAGYTSCGGELRGIEKDALLENIKENHIGHRIRFLCDLADDEESEGYADS
tara:strand:+ start:11014 stop:11214 length:201 start_codon:yes stop_codon:yes gene_type:complete